MAKHTSEIHELTTAEIARQIRGHSERHRQIVAERGSMYAAALKNGGASGFPPLIDDDEKAARLHAKHLLNGAAPESLSLPPEITRDRMLLREQRGIEIALKILTDQDLTARATEAVQWAEANGDRWRTLCREIVLTTIKLEALKHGASELLGHCPDIFAVRLPMANIAISEIPINELTETALTAGVVTSAEIRKAQNVA
jgi:hypothetical protein